LSRGDPDRPRLSVQPVERALWSPPRPLLGLAGFSRFLKGGQQFAASCSNSSPEPARPTGARGFSAERCRPRKRGNPLRCARSSKSPRQIAAAGAFAGGRWQILGEGTLVALSSSSSFGRRRSVGGCSAAKQSRATGRRASREHERLSLGREMMISTRLASCQVLLQQLHRRKSAVRWRSVCIPRMTCEGKRSLINARRRLNAPFSPILRGSADVRGCSNYPRLSGHRENLGCFRLRRARWLIARTWFASSVIPCRALASADFLSSWFPCKVLAALLSGVAMTASLPPPTRQRRPDSPVSALVSRTNSSRCATTSRQRRRYIKTQDGIYALRDRRRRRADVIKDRFRAAPASRCARLALRIPTTRLRYKMTPASSCPSAERSSRLPTATARARCCVRPDDLYVRRSSFEWLAVEYNRRCDRSSFR